MYPQITTISIMSVSPEGIVRFWPNLSSPGIFIESMTGLSGKECYMLVPVLVSHFLFLLYS